MKTFQIIYDYRDGIATGLLTTLGLCLVVWILGISCGILLGVYSHKEKVLIGPISKMLSFILSGVPVLVLLFWFHYPVQYLLDVVINPFYTAAFVLSLINVFLVSDIIRETLERFPTEYSTIGFVCGLSKWTVFKKIQLPLVMRHVLPTLIQIQVGMLQASLFASLISVNEIFRVTQQINSNVHSPVEVYSAVAVLFLAICLPMNFIARYLKKKTYRDFTER